jgi:hypothetical protein
MKKLFAAIVFVLTLYGQACAYVTDRVLVSGAAKNANSKEAALLAKEVVVTVQDALLEAFPCLQVTTQGELVKELDDLRTLALLGPGGWQWYNNANADNLDSTSQTTTYEEEKAFQQQIDDKLAELAKAAGAKYLVRVETTSDKNLSGISIFALNMKNAETYYRDSKIFSSSAAAIADSKTVAQKLVKGFTEYLSSQKGGTGEICPFTGRVDVYREENIERNDKVIRPNYCNGMDVIDSVTDKFTSHVREVWSLERFGNPDTRGGLEAQIKKETLHEEVDNCYHCGPDQVSRRVLRSNISVDGSINGLSEKSKGESGNRDATVKLEFKKDGTYYVIVKTSSETGEKRETVSESATGFCNNFNNTDPPKILPLTLNFEYRFGPFSGTPLDEKLSGQKEVKLQNEDIKAETILRIDFELEGFKRK